MIIPENMKLAPGALSGVGHFARLLQGIPEKTEADYFPLPELHYNGQRVYVSQSMLKDWDKLAMGEMCPKQFYCKYLLNEETSPSSDAQNAGRRFEYELTGAHDRYGNEPEQVLTTTGKIGTEQKRVSENAERARATLRRHGFDMDNFQAGVRLRTTEGLQGDLDLITTRNGELCIVDIKYSGLIGNEWNELGWNWQDSSRNRLSQNDYHTCQANHYQILAALHPDFPDSILSFFFAVFDARPNHEGEYRIFQMVSSEKSRMRHLQKVCDCIEGLQTLIDTNGLEATPEYDFCKSCLVNCPVRAEWPEIVQIEME